MTSSAIPVDMTQDLYQIPEQDTDLMYQTVQPVNVSRLTTGVVGGTGVFDLLMVSLNAQLQMQFANNRITGSEYTKTYIAMIEAALQTSLQFVLGADQAFWQSQNAQIAAVTGRIALEAARYNYTDVLPLQTAQLTLQNAGITTANQIAVYNLDNMMPGQLAVLTAQALLVHEQAEVQHAQTQDTRLDGVTNVVGVMGAQEALYKQQVTSYQRDAEVKAAKIWSDSWITQKTIDDTLLPPQAFTNDSVNNVLAVVMTNNGFNLATATAAEASGTSADVA